MHIPSYHEPVLLREAVDQLISDSSGTYIDGTLGGGGHVTAILGRLSDKGRVFGIDQDDEAIAEATRRISDPRFSAVKGNFGYMDVILPVSLRGACSGILLDLGVSSHQINDGRRGFSFREDGPLDMRMNPAEGTSAEEILNTCEEADLRRILFEYGEERLSRKIAEAIVNRRPLKTTRDLRAAVEATVKGPHQVKSVARVFQAIRIEVNRELDMLKSALTRSLTMLKPKGRLVAISYHSLEDRLVKNFMRAGNFEGVLTKDFYGNDMRPLLPLKPAPIFPDDSEIDRNPRARSARMRVAERLEVAA